MEILRIERHRAEMMLSDMIRGKTESAYLEMAIISMQTELDFSACEEIKKALTVVAVKAS